MKRSGSELDTPVVMFMFTRKEGALAVIERIAQVRPRRLYLISDGGRNEAEHQLVEECRKAVESRIDWGCEVVRNYSAINVGVHDRIGLGAKWVLSIEDRAIFLEDDNLPELSFFPYCEELLERFENDTRVLWICGTNYLGQSSFDGAASYTFTKHLLPCGWASWADKFTRFYDADLALFTPDLVTRVGAEYLDRRVCSQDLDNVRAEARRRDSGQRYWSWDYHMAYSIRVHGLLGVAPTVNQIKNIGVDEFSAHGGSSFSDVMTQRFCGMGSAPLEFPLVHPKVILRDQEFDRQLNRIVLYPARRRARIGVSRTVKRFLRVLARIARHSFWSPAKEHAGQ